MAQTTLTMRVDDELKKGFDSLCDDFGLTSTAAITLFMKAVVRECRIPFEIKSQTRKQANDAAWDAFVKMREQAARAGVQDMSLEEINAMIKEVRDAE